MHWRDTRYFIAYLMPLSTMWALYAKGGWSFATVLLAFVLIPLLELFFPRRTANLSPSQEAQKQAAPLFDWLLYCNVPILFGLLIYYFHTIAQSELDHFELVGITASMGVVIGTTGINVAHELGHRTTYHERWMAKALLMSALYMHFIIEHNRGHHKNVATDADPASARLGETVYAFWWRSIGGSCRHAWQLEGARLRKAGLRFWSWQNEMLRFQWIQALYLLCIGWLFAWQMMFFALAIALLGVLMLETINYIEHYGLRRKMINQRYEKISSRHSWNSNHELGRIFLYELTRHSDHHYKASRKYQLLRHFDDSPQLPLGYPASMLMALVPPLWFGIMNPKIKALQC